VNYYSLALFFHIVGALGFFVALGLEWVGLQQMRNATTTEQIRQGMRISGSTSRLGMASILTILVFGFYLAAVAWGGSAWIIVTLGAMVVMIALSVALTGPRMAALGRALASEKGPLSPSLQQLASHPLLWTSIQTRVAMALGIVFLMTVKPGLGGSLLTVGVSTVLGLAFSLPMKRNQRVLEGPAD
jgi:predicted lysophospholipase L1 biosynthesis ABC-type transport system permease subunit